MSGFPYKKDRFVIDYTTGKRTVIDTSHMIIEEQEEEKKEKNMQRYSMYATLFVSKGIRDFLKQLKKGDRDEGSKDLTYEEVIRAFMNIIRAFNLAFSGLGEKEIGRAGPVFQAELDRRELELFERLVEE